MRRLDDKPKKSWARVLVETNCKKCGVRFKKKRRENVYCSVDCSKLAGAGIGNKKKNGKTITCEVCSIRVYRPLTHLVGRKNHFCSSQCVGLFKTGKPNEKLAGKNAWNWQGGTKTLRRKIHGLFQYTQWRKSVFERDDFTCQICFTRGGELNADHIIPFSLVIKKNEIKSKEDARLCTELWDVSNGRTLCVPCHRQTSTWGHRVHQINLSYALS